MTYAGKNFSNQDEDEVNALSFDFVNELGAGETITAVVWTIEVVAGVDADAATRLIGVGSTTGSIVSHKVGNLLNGTGYRLRATATTSLGNILSLWSYVFCYPPR